jgi:hypothetical protein
MHNPAGARSGIRLSSSTLSCRIHPLASDRARPESATGRGDSARARVQRGACTPGELERYDVSESAGCAGACDGVKQWNEVSETGHKRARAHGQCGRKGARAARGTARAGRGHPSAFSVRATLDCRPCRPQLDEMPEPFREIRPGVGFRDESRFYARGRPAARAGH